MITESFCNYFSNITNDFQSKLTSVNSNFSKLREFIRACRHLWDIQFRIPMVMEDFARTKLLNLKVNSATGIDNLGAKLLSCAAPIIAPHIARICNLSITYSTMPKCWKFAKVTPIFKGGDHTNMNCYRPISVLPLLSKIIERNMFDEQYNYLVTYDTISPKHNSCQSLQLKISDYLLQSMEQVQISGLTLVNLQKAFHLVDHPKLLQKLQLYGLIMKR